VILPIFRKVAVTSTTPGLEIWKMSLNVSHL